MFRQGDILIVPVAALPDGARERPRHSARVVLATGEATGHAHAVSDGAVVEYDWPDAETGAAQHLLQVLAPCSVTHDEHDPILLAPGVYRVTRQREYRDGVTLDVVD